MVYMLPEETKMHSHVLQKREKFVLLEGALYYVDSDWKDK